MTTDNNSLNNTANPLSFTSNDTENTLPTDKPSLNQQGMQEGDNLGYSTYTYNRDSWTGYTGKKSWWVAKTTPFSVARAVFFYIIAGKICDLSGVSPETRPFITYPSAAVGGGSAFWQKHEEKDLQDECQVRTEIGESNNITIKTTFHSTQRYSTSTGDGDQHLANVTAELLNNRKIRHKTTDVKSYTTDHSVKTWEAHLLGKGKGIIYDNLPKFRQNPNPKIITN